MKKRYYYLIFILSFVFSFYANTAAQDECDLTGFATFTQGGWGSSPSGNNPGTVREQIFPQAFPQGLTIGGTYKITLTSSDAVVAYLQGGGTPAPLTQSHINPTETESGNLGVQLTAVKLNIAYDASLAPKQYLLTDLIFTSGKFQGKTVAEFMALAEAALGGESIAGKGYTYSDLNDAAASINENFNDGANKKSLTCPVDNPDPKASLGDRVWVDLNDNGLQDDGNTGVEGVTVQLYKCTGELIKETTTNSQGYYFFHDVPAGNYYVKITVPDNYSIGKMDQGNDDAADSDFRQDARTECFPFAGTNDDFTFDCALVQHLFTDLEVLKTASKVNVECGETFSYTVTVKNNGPLSASAIVVADILPAGTDFVDFSATQGTYLQSTGEWNAGSLNKGQSATLTLNVKADCGSLQSNPIDLGAAKGFNLFVLGSLNQPSADTQGKVAVGGNATLSNYSVGDLLPPKSGGVLIVGGNLTFTSGSVSNGNVVYGGTTNLPQSLVSITGGTLRHGSPVDFPAAKTFLQNMSQRLSTLLPNGSTRFEWGKVTLIGKDTKLNIFIISGSDISAANNFEVIVPEGSSVLVNISGNNVRWTGGLVLAGAKVSKVIYNFFQAQSLQIHGIDLRGTVLAPLADVDFPAGLVTGQMIAKSVTGSGQFNDDPWDGEVPGSISFTNTASLKGSIPVDNNPDNNSSSVTVYAGVTSELINGFADREVLPSDFSLRQNYPNPFNPSTTIEFAVPNAGRYALKVFNMLGQEISTVLDRDLSAGYHKALFDASKVPSGIYFYRLTGNNVYLIRKMILAK